MYLQHLKITNYKSFLQPTDFEFRPGFNVLLGANSSGKSSVLEALKFSSFANVPHRSLLNRQDLETPTSGNSSTEVSFHVSLDELRRFTPRTYPLLIGNGTQETGIVESSIEVLNHRLSSERIQLEFRNAHAEGTFARLGLTGLPSTWRPMHSNATFPAARILEKEVDLLSNFGSGPDEIRPLWEKVAAKTYKFAAERSVQETSPHHPDQELSQDASNLAYCIGHLATSNPEIFAELNRLLHRVFPTIHWASGTPDGSTQFALRVHNNPMSSKRGDLGIPISCVGTGVGNALAMLYVALTSQTQRFILLEEPNSYLHPRALRELLAILAEVGSRHQYFITTHSSDVLRTVKASTVTLLEHDGVQTTIKQTSGDKLHELQAGLVELGISLTDLHGCDKVLWTEGETEAAIFPMLLQHFFPEVAQGIAVLPLHATGDFEARKFEPQKVAAIYKKLSAGSFLAPPMVAITLDREKKPDSLIRKIEEDSDGLIHFLPKTMLEDYLLDASAITQAINDSYGLSVSEEQVSNALTKALEDVENRLFPKNPEDTRVHAAKVLEMVFASFPPITGNRAPTYRKTADGPKIAEYLLRHKPAELMPLKTWFQSFIGGMDKKTDPA